MSGPTPASEYAGRIIGFWGAARSGKDTIGRAMALPGAHFAGELKNDLLPLAAKLGLDLDDPLGKEIFRPVMVAWGAACRRKDPLHWVKRLRLPREPIVGVRDVRYLNECLFIWNKGGIVFETVRPGYGPVNDEERRSFAEIREHCAAHGIDIPVLYNDKLDHGRSCAIDAWLQVHAHFRRAA